MSRDLASLEAFYGRELDLILADPGFAEAHEALLRNLESGELRSARREPDGSWNAVTWVKRGILAGFRATETVPFEEWPCGAFDRSAFPPRRFAAEDRIRLVPGGSAVRRGACLKPGVVVMPPAYVNVGAFVGSGSMIDSHALVGSCAQVGENTHLSAGVQVGGVLEPAGARPVVVEDECLVGALCGLFEGVLVRRRAVLAPGVILTASTAIYDLVEARMIRGEVPEAAVVVPGSRPAGGEFAEKQGISLYAPCIVKYRDAKTDAATALEAALR